MEPFEHYSLQKQSNSVSISIMTASTWRRHFRNSV